MKKTRMTIDISQSDHKRLKTASSLMGISMKSMVIMSVEYFIRKEMKKFLSCKNYLTKDELTDQIKQILSYQFAVKP